MSDISKLQDEIDFEINELGVSASSARIKEMRKRLAKLKTKDKQKEKLAKSKGWNEDSTMDVLGGYVLDMKKQGKLIGHRDASGKIIYRNPSTVIKHLRKGISGHIRIVNGQLIIKT